MKKQADCAQGDISRTSLPETEQFRAWVASSIRSLGLPVSGVSKGAGMSQNALARFLNMSGSEIHLGSARRIEAALAEAAIAAGIDLPRVAA